jgi:hypothetical protein
VTTELTRSPGATTFRARALALRRSKQFVPLLGLGIALVLGLAIRLYYVSR